MHTFSVLLAARLLHRPPGCSNAPLQELAVINHMSQQGMQYGAPHVDTCGRNTLPTASTTFLHARGAYTFQRR